MGTGSKTRFNHVFLVALLAASLISTSAIAESDEVNFDEAYALIQNHLQRTAREHQTPGMAMAITARDRPLHEFYQGVSDLKTQEPVTSETLLAIGSIGKSFTAVALLALHDDGLIDAHEPVSKFLPWWKVDSTMPITAHHLLTHMSGMPGYRGDMSCSIYETLWMNQLPFQLEPDKQYHYSSNGYSILGHLIRAVSGQAYSEVVRQKILDPLEMNHSEPVLVNEMRQRLAASYRPLYDDRPKHPDDPLVDAGFYEYSLGAGSVSCTASDLAKYLRMLLNRGQGALTEKSFQLLTQRVVPRGPGYHYGYGLEVLERNGHTVLRHGGGCFGFQSILVGDLDDGLGVVLLANGPTDGSFAEFALQVMQAARAGKPLPAPPPPSPLVADPADYAGVYQATDGRQLKFRAVGSDLVLDYNDQVVKLALTGPDQYCTRHPDLSKFLLRFGRQASNVVAVSHGSDWYVNDHYDGPREFDVSRSWLAYPGRYRATTLPPTRLSVVLKKGTLWLVGSGGQETELVSTGNGKFRLRNLPEWLHFDTIVEDQALRVDYSGATCYRY